MHIDEFEAIRLGDYHNLKQKQSAELMGISQPTFHRILNSVISKTAKSLIEGIEIEIYNDNLLKKTMFIYVKIVDFNGVILKKYTFLVLIAIQQTLKQLI